MVRQKDNKELEYFENKKCQAKISWNLFLLEMIAWKYVKVVFTNFTLIPFAI